MKKKITDLKNKEDDIWYTYDQTIDWVTYNWCREIHRWTAFSTIWNYKLSMDERRWFLQQTKDRGFNPNKWYPIEDAMRLANILRNMKFPTMQVKCWEWKFDTPEMRVHLNLGKPVGLWLNTWPKYRNDREDGKLAEMLYRSDDIESSHMIVYKFFHSVKKFLLLDTRFDEKTYEASREYMTKVKGLLAKRKNENFSRILLYDKA